jgi:filamentous hemagglutinin family protein
MEDTLMNRYKSGNLVYRLGVAFLALLFFIYTIPLPVFANPTGGHVVAGEATFSGQPSEMTVNQASDRAVINWQGFSINSGELTRFIQPSAQSAVLNRVTSALSSAINGSLEANGQVFLINPNGVVVGLTGRINTASFVASTLDIPDSQFMAGGDLGFFGDSEAGISNLGIIEAAGGDIVLIARHVENAGTLSAPEGTVGLATGSEVLLSQAADPRIFIETDLSLSETDEIGVTNTGLIEAASVELQAAGGSVYALAVNNGGVIHATGMVNEGGRVLLKSQGGAIENSGTITARQADGDGSMIVIQAEDETGSSISSSGTLDASGTAPGSMGGSVTLTADNISLFDEACIDVSGDSGGGTILIGGDYKGKNPDIYNAKEVFVSEDVLLNADAITEGDGGRVIVWSDEAMGFYGTISALGGELSGDGGFAEVSGKNSLIYEGLTDTRAPKGQWGTLLLDPINITINSDYNHIPPLWLDPNIITSNLVNTSVTITTESAGTDAGNIYFEKGIISWETPTTLSLIADNGIWLDSGTEIGYAYSTNLPGVGGLYLKAKGIFQESGSTIHADSIFQISLESRFHPSHPFTHYPYEFNGQIVAGKLALYSVDEATIWLDSGHYQFNMKNSGNNIRSIEFLPPVQDNESVFDGDFHFFTGSNDLTLKSDPVNYVFGNLTIRTKGNLTFPPGTKIKLTPAIWTGGVLSKELVLDSKNFINNSGFGVSTFNNTRRFLVYSTHPLNDNPGGLTARHIYNRTYTANPPSSLPMENLFLYSITPVITFNAENKTKPYGGDNPALTYTAVIPTYEGFTGVPSLSTTATKTSGIGPYAINIEKGTLEAAEGAQFEFNPGTLTITSAPLTITANDVIRLYGEPNPTVFPTTFEGLMSWDTQGVVTGLSVGTAATQQSDVGNYPITLSGGTAQNYSITLQNGTLTVNPSSLTISANDAIRRISDPNPEFSPTYQGLIDWDEDQNGLPLSGVVTGLTFTTNPLADENSPSGNYDIVPSGASANNYTITYNNGTLTIKEPYHLVITAQDKSRPYGDPNPELTVTYFGFEDNDDASVVSGLNLSTTAEPRSNVGDYPITINNVTVPSYYTTIFVDGTLTVEPRELHIWANDTTCQYGDTPSLSATVDTLLPGDNFSSGYDIVVPPGRLNVGIYPISIIGGIAPNYEIVRHDGTFTVTTAPLTVRPNDTVITKGQPYPPFTVSCTGLNYDETASVLSGLNLVPVDQISYVDSQGNLTIRAGIHGTDKSTMFINQSGELVAQNYSPITFQPGILTILEPQPQVITVTIETTQIITGSGATTQYGVVQSMPFGVPPEGQGFIQYAAKRFIREAGLDVPNIGVWLQDPVNRGLMLQYLIEGLKAPLKEGTELYQQREITKSYFENQLREMKVQIAKDAVQKYNDWKEKQQEDSSRLLGLLGGTLETPDEDFVSTATGQYIGAAISATSIAALVTTFASMSAAATVPSITFGGGAILAGTSYGKMLMAAGLSASSVGTVAGIASGVIFAVTTAVTRGLQLSEYEKVEERYANLVNDARNFDIDSLLTGDSAAQEELSSLMLVTAMRQPIW